MTTNTIQVQPNAGVATQIVAAGEGPTLVTNTDLANTVYLGDNDAIRATDSQGIVPLGPNASVVLNGQSNLFAVNPNPAPVTLATLTGGLGNFLGITQGYGKLAIPAIQSPNFQPNPLIGWSIDKDGNAYFETVSIGNGVVRVTFAAVAPSSPNEGDVWFNLSSGVQPNVFQSGAWQPYQWGQPSIANNAIGTNQIANNAVTPAQIASLSASLIGNTGGVLNANPYLLGGDLSGWIASNGAILTVTNAPPANAPFKWAAKIVYATSTKLYDYNEKFPVTPNDQYLATGWVNSPDATVTIGFDWRTSAGAYISSSTAIVNVTPNVWSQISTVQTAPAGVALANITVIPATANGTMYAQGLIALHQIPGSLIQAGTVDATRLIAGLVYAGIIDGTIVNAATFNGSTFNGTQFIANSKGIFLYNGVPGPSNLYISIAPTFGNDPFGTAFPTGIKIFGANGAQTNLQNNGTSAVVQMLAAGMTHNTVQAQVAAEQVLPGAVNESSMLYLSSGKENNLDDAVLELISDSADGTVKGTAKIQFGLTPVVTVGKTEIDVTAPIVIDQWNNMVLLNGWTNNASFVQARYRKVASPPNSVQIQAFISGNAASNGTFFKLPAGYVPTNSQGFAVGCTSSADSTDGRVDTSGNLSIANVVMPAAQTFFINDVISLD